MEFSDWLPMPPTEGPPLPRFLGIFWPWYKEGAPPVEPEPGGIIIEIYDSEGNPLPR